jgi:orotate phosphoribosyltransferase
METAEVQVLLEQAGALLEGHFVLSSGKHSDRYVQCALLLQHPAKAGLVGAAIGALWRGHSERDGRSADERIDVVLGPALGGIVVAHEVARYLGTRALFGERRDGVMTLRRGFRIEPGERVLLVEDVVTTGGSVAEIARLAARAGGNVVGAGAVIDRRNLDRNLDRDCDRDLDLGQGPEQPIAFEEGRAFELRALLKVSASVWDPGQCPLCAQGLPAEKPGSREIER